MLQGHSLMLSAWGQERHKEEDLTGAKTVANFNRLFRCGEKNTSCHSPQG